MKVNFGGIHTSAVHTDIGCNAVNAAKGTVSVDRLTTRDHHPQHLCSAYWFTIKSLSKKFVVLYWEAANEDLVFTQQ
ncbi:hypothetical protein OUZ56_031849 [Daphnia magna]|uniref:Uncharacterized protein n=1 Tax=Daphnia magna TaxID=35525 RepID=A0ABQ9ZWG1_9CRUS|nr:hypothetical protein OUZ56_031849 [Daphnia magna]